MIKRMILFPYEDFFRVLILGRTLRDSTAKFAKSMDRLIQIIVSTKHCLEEF